MSRRIAPAAAALAALLLVAHAAPRADAPAAPMTDDDVVALVAKGVPEAEIAAAVRSRPPAFDLSPEMLEELRAAGVTETLLRVMRERQSAAPSSSPVPVPTMAAARSRVEIHVAVEGTRGQKRRFVLPARVDAKTARTLGADVPLLAESPRIEEAAIFLACATAEHVPDGWKEASPLGTAFPAVPRHEMLAFVPFSPPAEKKDAPVEIVPPDSLTADLVSDEAHDLMFGVAVRLAGEWHVAAAGGFKGVRPADPASAVEAVLRAGKGRLGLEAEIRSAGRRSSKPQPPPS